jgi:hypothetical protein
MVRISAVIERVMVAMIAIPWGKVGAKAAGRFGGFPNACVV